MSFVGILSSTTREKWELISVPQNVFNPETFLAVAPLNNTQFVIMGGERSAWCSSSVVIFDTRTKKCGEVIEDERAIKLCAHWDHSNMLVNNNMVAIVESKIPRIKNAYKRTLIEWTEGT